MQNTNLEERYKFFIRNGSYYSSYTTGFRHAMPAFGSPVISDSELNELVNWLLYAPPLGGSNSVTGVEPPPVPSGRQIVVEITDEAPWYRDDATDVRDPANDRRRVVMSPGDYLKIVNRGKTWHTATSRQASFDTGFIGYSGNIPEQDTGYAYLELSDIQSGAWNFFCALHPYMQFEVVTPTESPTPVTHVSKIPIGLPPSQGIGEVWVGLQTYNNAGAPNGAVEVIDASNWSSSFIANVGNNPHNGWIGMALDPQGVPRKVAVWTNWHDVTVTVIDAEGKSVLGDIPVGAANAHIMTQPAIAADTIEDAWYLTVMGSNKVQRINPILEIGALEPEASAISQSSGVVGQPAFSPHGIWFLGDSEHFVTADTLDNKASLYSTLEAWSDSQGRSGIGKEVAQAGTGGSSPLAATVFHRNLRPDRQFMVYTNNAGTSDISVFSANTTPGAKSLTRIMVPPPLGNSRGNLDLMDMMGTPIRWAHMPIQLAVSPPDATEHGRYLFVANKASFNVSVISLDENGMPTGIYTFPSGLGAHGVAFGRVQSGSGDSVSYYAYVTNTFQNYVSVYDLKLLDRMIALERLGAAPPEFGKGGTNEQVYVEGYAAQALLGQPNGVVPLVVFSPDARGLVHVGDLPLTTPAKPSPRAYLKEAVMVDLPGYGPMELDLDLTVDTGAMGIFCNPLPPPWSPLGN